MIQVTPRVRTTALAPEASRSPRVWNSLLPGLRWLRVSYEHSWTSFCELLNTSSPTATGLVFVLGHAVLVVRCWKWSEWTRPSASVPLLLLHACLERFVRCCPWQCSVWGCFCETVEDVPDELCAGRGAFDIEFAPLNKLIIIIIIIIIILNTLKYTYLLTYLLTYLRTYLPTYLSKTVTTSSFHELSRQKMSSKSAYNFVSIYNLLTDIYSDRLQMLHETLHYITLGLSIVP